MRRASRRRVPTRGVPTRLVGRASGSADSDRPVDAIGPPRPESAPGLGCRYRRVRRLAVDRRRRRFRPTPFCPRRGPTRSRHDPWGRVRGGTTCPGTTPPDVGRPGGHRRSRCSPNAGRERTSAGRMCRPDHLADRPRDRRLVVRQRACHEGFTVVVAERDHDLSVFRVARVDQYGDTDDECDRQVPNPEPPGVPLIREGRADSHAPDTEDRSDRCAASRPAPRRLSGPHPGDVVAGGDRRLHPTHVTA